MSAPSPRVGSASTSLGGKLYLFSGRGGTAMTPIDEEGGLWQFDPKKRSWSLLKPTDGNVSVPLPRSYHCMTNDGSETLYVHAGCPQTGRLADLWAYNIVSRTWIQLADAPSPPRGGTSIAFSNGRLFRMNGFDGKTEQGGHIDIFDIPTGRWSTKSYQADGISGPEARSVAALLALILSNRTTLVTLFGERDPSSVGHAGAGSMLGDFWLYDIEHNIWSKGKSRSSDLPTPRGWFDADVLGSNKVVVAGGLDEHNNRLQDMWTLTFE